MQVDTQCPRVIVDMDSGARYFLRRDDDGRRRYHRSRTDRGQLPSAFFSHSGQLYSNYRAA